GRRWERRVLDSPSQIFSFEVGRFKLQTAQAGHVRVTTAFDPEGSHLHREIRAEITATVADALVYYEQTFGPYPLDELTVVTVPRGFSQSTQGLVTLSDEMMDEYGRLGQLLGISDHRAVIAHEVAHQWWGDAVGWASYRDQWISEALASYCALLYVRQRLDPKQAVVGLTARWRESLMRETAGGRTIESIGPVILGGRLDSSLASDANIAIVYDKGTVVLDTLAYTLGAEDFPRVLRQVFKATVNRTLSTEDLLAAIAAITSTDLSAFANRFIYSTGLPMILYTYRFEPAPGGGFKVIGKIRQDTLPLSRYRLVRTAAGKLDLVHEPPIAEGPALPVLAAPAAVDFYDAARHGRRGEANATLHGRFIVRGESSDFALDVPGNPRTFALDRRHEVFAIFLDESRHPRRASLVSGILAANRGRTADAEALLDRALGAEEQEEAYYWAGKQRAERLLTAVIQLARARLFLDQGRDADAEHALDRADVPSGTRGPAVRERELLLSWLDVRRGRFDRAFHRLDDSRFDSVESTLLYAIAAQATGHREELAKAMKAARLKGADAGLLQDAAAAVR
ncbi:MAG: hypothetical protein JOZ15_03575, partial [Acidobacteria bacterium]|nr:hypothetical protein [Acidobacteriota bacterium]